MTMFCELSFSIGRTGGLRLSPMPELPPVSSTGVAPPQGLLLPDAAEPSILNSPISAAPFPCGGLGGARGLFFFPCVAAPRTSPDRRGPPAGAGVLSLPTRPGSFARGVGRPIPTGNPLCFAAGRAGAPHLHLSTRLSEVPGFLAPRERLQAPCHDYCQDGRIMPAPSFRGRSGRSGQISRYLP